ncbi:hypothetical protein MS3_00000416 [Schistosoma haematobium]|uniref:Uncharacterized protein n=1 Tax=Schistosoma haematobium TaxID=6185 RepID=A0A922LFZ9_SCHHA|nr:hypothetical protein MS3_00000416 [Schistosoma haematobium]KAH9582961.1 hypothetical protein MS3_00000416 [Schistosoma haematobium]
MKVIYSDYNKPIIHLLRCLIIGKSGGDCFVTVIHKPSNNSDQSTYSPSYGKKSRCFIYGNGDLAFAGCFKVKCSLEFKHLVYFRGEWRECPRDGGIMEIAEDITGRDWIQCPRFHDLCSVKKIQGRNERREKEQNLIAQS